MPTLLIVAGETSGDIHGANLALALRELDPTIRLVGAGGPRMRAAGVELVEDTTSYAAIGFVEAFHQMHQYARLYRRLQSPLRTHKPDATILIDYPDFNLRFAERSVAHGVPVIYYISPQVWAWRQGRVKTIRRLVRKMIVVFEFEAEFYRKHDVDVAFVGHPLLDHFRVEANRPLRAELGIGDAPLIGLLPGSRKKQFRALFPRMKRASELIRREIPAMRFIVAGAPSVKPYLEEESGLPVVWNRTHDVMAAADLLLTISGTSTVEAVVHGTPMVIAYHANPATAFVMRRIVTVNRIGMVNLIAGREIMPEFFQERATPELLAKEAISIFRENRLPKMREDLAEVRRRLGEPGASKRAAQEVLKAIGIHPGRPS